MGDLTNQGYAVLKRTMSKTDFKNLKKELTIIPKIFDEYGAEPVPFEVFREDEKYIYIPRFYGTSKYGKPKNDYLEDGVDIDTEFLEPLRDYQIPIVDKLYSHLIKAGGGVLTLPCGRGKTAIAINVITKMKKKALVVVHKRFLMRQWIQRLSQFSDAKVGIIQRDTVDVEGKDVVVAMLKSLSTRDYDADMMKEFGLVVYDECFPFGQRIVTSEGNIKIGQLYKMWNNDEKLPLILSYNGDTEKFEYKEMTYAWKKINPNLVKVKMSQKTFTCTENHQILTTKGYIMAKNLTKGDLIISNYDTTIKQNMVAKGLNSDQEQILYGSFLGDGHIDSLESGRIRLKIIHGYKQRAYCKWKASMFGVDTEIVEKNGYSQKKAIRFDTKIIDTEEIYPSEKTVCPQWLIDKIDVRALAIWAMDDGSINKKGTAFTFHTESFDTDSQQRLVNKLCDMGIQCKYMATEKKKKKKKYNNIRVCDKGTRKLISLIYPYMHKSMMYKLETKTFINWMEDLTKKYTKNTIYNHIINVDKNDLKSNRIFKVKNTRGVNGVTEYKLVDCENCTSCCIHIKSRDCKSWNCLSWDIAKKVENNYNIPSFEDYEWNKEFKEWGTIRIKSVKKFTYKKTGRESNESNVFDIEVNDNHNFVLAHNTKYAVGEVVHNCHRAGARVSSKALQKLVPKYSLGLSATPDRGDGTSKVLYWHIGEIIHREEAQSNESVISNIYKFKTDNKDFKEYKNWANGTPNREKTITKLTQLPERNQFILSVIEELRHQCETRKILILSQRIEHLETLDIMIRKSVKRDKKRLKLMEELKENIELTIRNKKKINKNTLEPTLHLSVKEDQKLLDMVEEELHMFEVSNCANHTVGFYIGKKKEAELAEAEKCDIILGSYGMAEEGLDIEALNTVILASPRRNVTQSVGRILRKLEYEFNPVIVDIADQLPFTSSQSTARQMYYNKCKYNMCIYDVNDNKVTEVDYIPSSRVLIDNRVKAEMAMGCQFIDDE